MSLIRTGCFNGTHYLTPLTPYSLNPRNVSTAQTHTRYTDTVHTRRRKTHTKKFALIQNKYETFDFQNKYRQNKE